MLEESPESSQMFASLVLELLAELGLLESPLVDEFPPEFMKFVCCMRLGGFIMGVRFVKSDPELEYKDCWYPWLVTEEDTLGPFIYICEEFFPN